MPEHQNELSDSNELTDITPIRGNNETTYSTPMRGNNDVTYPTPMRGNNEATFVTPMQGGNNDVTYSTPIQGNNETTFPTPMQGHNEATFVTPMQSGSNETTFPSSIRGNYDVTYPAPMQGNNEATYSTSMKGNNEQTYITSGQGHNERIDLITTKPMPTVPSLPHKRSIGRRELLIGGGVALLALAGGGTALSMALSNTGKDSTSTSVTPTVVLRPRNLVPGENVLTIAAHSDIVTNALWDPTGRYLASASDDGFIKVWDVGNMVQKQAGGPRTLSQPVWAQLFRDPSSFSKSPVLFSHDTLHWSADGRKLITLVPDKNSLSEPFLWSPFTNDTKGQLFTNTKAKVRKTFFYTPMPAPHGTTLAAIDMNSDRYHKVDLWQMNRPNAPFTNLTYQDPNQFIGDASILSIIGWSCDGSLLAGLFDSSDQWSKSRNIVIWDVKTRAVKAAFHIPGQSVDMAIGRIVLSWSPVDPHLLAVFNLDRIAVVDASQGKVLYQLSTDDHDAALSSTSGPQKKLMPLVFAFTWSPDGRYIVGSFASSTKFYIWDTQAKNAPTKGDARLPQLIFPQANDPFAHTDLISDISWSPDGRFLATASYDKSIKVWKVDGHG